MVCKIIIIFMNMCAFAGEQANVKKTLFINQLLRAAARVREGDKIERGLWEKRRPPDKREDMVRHMSVVGDTV